MAVRWADGTDGDVIAMDDTYFPVLVATWMGAPTEKSVRAYFQWLGEMLARARREGTPLVNVTDAGPAKTPGPDVRRLISELTKAWEATGADAKAVTAYVVVDNALIRGVLTALGWLHGDLHVTHVSTCAEALDGALLALARARKPAPVGLSPEKWRRPERFRRAT
jgi:hypothetical protein